MKMKVRDSSPFDRENAIPIKLAQLAQRVQDTATVRERMEGWYDG